MSTSYNKDIQYTELLGITAGSRIAVINAPVDYCNKLKPLPHDIVLDHGDESGYDIIQLFTVAVSILEERLPALSELLNEEGNIWITWPRPVSETMTDITERIVRDTASLSRLHAEDLCLVLDQDWKCLKISR